MDSLYYDGMTTGHWYDTLRRLLSIGTRNKPAWMKNVTFDDGEQIPKFVAKDGVYYKILTYRNALDWDYLDTKSLGYQVLDLEVVRASDDDITVIQVMGN